MTSSDRLRVPPAVLVLTAVGSVQFGGALAATLIPAVGATGAVTLRLVLGALMLALVVRPRLRGYAAGDWRTVLAFGVVLGLMNLSFYLSLERLPIGVAVTVEFVGPLLYAATLSRRVIDLVAVSVAGVGVVLIAEILSTPWAELDVIGLGFAAAAGAFWAAYIALSARTGARFASLDGVSIAMVVAAAMIAPFGLGDALGATPAILAAGIGVALLSGVIPYSLELLALRRMGQRVFGVLLSTEPAAAALAGWVVLAQVLTPTQLVGMACVIAASVVVLSRPSERRPPTD